MASTLKLLVVFAHPDDESMGMGGTLAKYSAEGVETNYVCATRGERGWFGPEEQNPGLQRLGQLRSQELEHAVKELGMKGLYFLGTIDGEVDQADHREAIGKIVTHIRRIQPQVIVTFPPMGITAIPITLPSGNSPARQLSARQIQVIRTLNSCPPIAFQSSIIWLIQKTSSTSSRRSWKI